ncbi:MAG: DUF4065 domain-containing protein [Hydrogenibacillus schlegelii]|uniref:DUF4065 domain-containing protein n=1 Tax=Hydrogenibacillus schlegelii TaxID=1484 RepID=A0A947CYB4_HYDSH|nr:DUF4065 domain-containing protein [Hydrogenibacillus schlegelii]
MMKMERFCQTCDQFRPSHVEEREETFTVRGEPITVRGPVRICDVCGEIMGDEELDGALLVKAYNEYRRRHGLLMPEEIRAIREQYNLSQTAAAKLLGWDPSTFARYENGALQKKDHDELLRRMRDDKEWVRALYRQNGHRISSLQRQRLELALNEIREPTKIEETEATFERLNKEGEFNPGKLFTVIRLITEKAGKVSKSVFLKYLFYIDFLSLKWHEKPIMGLAYIKNHYGPVPQSHDELLDYLEAVGAVHREKIKRKGEDEAELIEGMPVERAEPLEEYELDVVDYVIETLKGMNAERIKEFSHKEPAWIEGEMKEVIPYAKAKTLRIG